MPILFVGNTLGVINIYVKEKHRRAQREEKFLTAVANTLAGIIERKRAEERLRRANRALKMISECNKTLLHLMDKSSFMHEICRIIVDVGGYRMAWVGLTEQDEAKTIHPAAQAGCEEGYLESVNITWADTGQGCNSTGTAIRTGKPCIVRNILTDPHYASRRAEAMKHGYTSSIALPLADEDGTLGALNIYAVEQNPFNKEEIKVLMELANDLVYGIQVLRTRAGRKCAEENLRESNRRLEDALAELQRIQKQVVEQERLRAVGQMASGIAHDLNNVLQPVLGYSDLLLMRPETLDDRAKTIRHLKLIRTAAEDAANVIHRLGAFYRVPDNDDALKPVDLNKLIKEVILLTKPKWVGQTQEKGGDIHMETDLQRVALIEGNETELRELFTNLIFNAVDAMPESGTIPIGTSHNGNHVILRVSDTGIGMTEDVRRRCMDPFFSTKTGGGTGMGLWMVRGIVERARGTISVESEPGKWTTFVVRLRASRKKNRVLEDRGGELVSGPLRVFLVEDDPEVRDLVSEYLTGDGHTVETAANGREGLEKFHPDRFDVVITDKAMPQMNGDQLARAIKNIAPDKPVILLTGFGHMIKAQDKCPPWVNLVVTKPVSLAQLRKALAGVGNHREVSCV